MSDNGLKAAFVKAGLTQQQINTVLFGSNGYNGLWADASKSFIENGRGELIVLAPNGDAVGKILSEVEIPAALANPNYSSINGIERSVWIETSNHISDTLGQGAVRSEIFDSIRGSSFAQNLVANVELKPLGEFDGAGNELYSARGFGEFFSNNNITVPEVPDLSGGAWKSVNHTIGAYGDDVIQLMGKAGDYFKAVTPYLGPVGDVLDGSLSAYRAYELYKSGDTQGAFAELAAFGASLQGGFWGGSAGLALASALGLAGPAGWGLAATVAIVGGLGGEAFGRWGFNGLADLYNGLGGWLDGVDGNFVDALRAQLIRFIDPIVLDLDGNGIELSGRANSNVYFDMDGDGIKELTGWVGPTDGLLAIDGNGNGNIDNINELIGDLGQSGFGELSTYDLNNDDVINASDAVWSKLRVWVDANSNGVTDVGELRTMASLNIRAIDLNYTAVNFKAEGNRIHEQSVFEYTNGNTGLAADIWFDVSNVATNATITTTGNVTIDDLPDIRGRGDVESLRKTMLGDAALTTLVSGFVAQGVGALGNSRVQVEQIIYRWAGVQTVDPASRGGLFDGRKLEALEEFMGTDFSVGGNANPLSQTVASLTAAWNGLVDGILARLLMSGHLGEQLADAAVYVPEIDRILTVQTPAELLASLAVAAPSADAKTIAGYWASVLPLAAETVQDVGGVTNNAAYASAVAAALAGTGLAPFTDLLDDGIKNMGAGLRQLNQSGVFNLSSTHDVLSITGGRMAVYAGNGNDVVSVASNTSAARLIDGGAGNDELQGGTGDDWIDGGAGVDTMAGGYGNDTYVVDNVGDIVLEIAGAGLDEVRSSITHTLAADLENLTLLGTAAINGTGNASNNQLTGNSGANRLEGLDGNDTLDGAAGTDTLVGGLGEDIYAIDNAGDVIIEAGTDVDLVRASINYTLGNKLERLELIGSALNGTGNGLNNYLLGNALNNVLNGGAGEDRMYGGAGDDTYYVDNRYDYVYENNNEGADTVRASVSYSLGSYVENLILTGVSDIYGEGNSGANQLTGNTGDNWLDGLAGADTMAGGLGDDTYIVDDTSDAVTEAANSGIDSVRTTLTDYTLAANLEDLRLYVSYDDNVARNGTGNTSSNQIIGTGGINVLNGLGGDDLLLANGGNDTLIGGAGNDLLDGGLGDDNMNGGADDDTYVVNSTLDVVTEAASGGTDTVRSLISFILGANVENLILTGTSTIDGQGNGLSNRLTGNSANNNLDGGAGVDVMAGGAGNDTYTVDNAGDVVLEAPGAGVDEVRSSVSYVLDLSVENLTLLGTSNITATGNAEGNVIVGNAGGNRINGGLGVDVMTGNAGADTFVFATIEDSGATSSACDRITDFAIAAGDRIDVSGIEANVATVADDAFSFIGTANFSAAGQIRTTVVSGVTYLHLNTDTNFSTAEMVIAMTGTPALSSTDFVV